jgi:hypothetical protein
VDCGNGTIKDTETGLFWLKDASCLGQKDWAAGNVAAAELGHGQCGLTDGSLPGDWRLPTLACSPIGQCPFSNATGEFASIFAPLCDSPFILDTAGTGCWSDGNPFSGVQSATYWSASTVPGIPHIAWVAVLSLNAGFVNDLTKSQNSWVWPVRDGL